VPLCIFFAKQEGIELCKIKVAVWNGSFCFDIALSLPGHIVVSGAKVFASETPCFAGYRCVKTAI